MYFNEDSIETQGFPEKREVPSPSGGQPLVMHIFSLLHKFKNMSSLLSSVVRKKIILCL